MYRWMLMEISFWYACTVCSCMLPVLSVKANYFVVQVLLVWHILLIFKMMSIQLVIIIPNFCYKAE